MPNLTFTDPQGRGLTVSSLDGSVPSEQELDQMFSQKYGNVSQPESIQTSESLGIEKGQLTSQERFSGGFRSPEDLQTRRDTQRQALGVEEGTPLEPTGFNMQNLLDMPNDVLDMVGPAFPALGQLFAGLGTAALTAPTGPGAVASGIAAGTVGSGFGEAVRQEVGKQLFGFEQGSAKSRLGRVALESGIGATGEIGGRIINTALGQTKRGIIKAAENMFKTQRIDKALQVLGKIAPDIDPEKTQFAINSLRQGDNRVLDKTFAEEAFALDHARKVLYGGKESSIVDHIHSLGKSAQPESVSALMKEYASIPEEITTRLMKNSTPIAYKNPATINKLAEGVSSKLTSAKDFEMERFGKVLDSSMKKYGNRDVQLTDINARFIENAKKIGVLNLDGEITPEFSGTSIGKVYQDFLEKFASKGERDLTKLKGEQLAEAISGKRVTQYIPESQFKLSKLSNDWKRLKNSITRDVFQAFEPKVTFPLAQYFDEVTGRMAKIAKMDIANKRYGNFMRLYRPIEEKTATKVGFNNFLMSLDDTNVLQNGVREFEGLLPKKSMTFSNDILNFNAVQKLLPFDQPVARSAIAERLASSMDNIFGTSSSQKGAQQLINRVIDPGLPKHLQIENLAKIHSVAKSLNRSAISLLRARFLAGGIGIGALLAGNPLAGVAGVGAGLILQDPRLFQQVLKRSVGSAPGFQAGLKGISNAIPSGVPRGSEQVISNLIRLANQNGQNP
jgi:hypothetical protein